MPIPILMTGKGEPIGRVLAATLQPEYEVIHFTLAASINDELPVLLTGKAPSPASSTIGTGNWSAPPQALLIGGAYKQEDIDALTKLVKSTDGAAQIPWLWVDSSKMAPPPQVPTEAQAKALGEALAKRMKDKLNSLSAEGKLGSGNGEIYTV